jgi:hypothetical protein
MPYFYNDNINLLFIHIPKTGGSNFENYMSYKYNIPLNEKSLSTKRLNNISYQHLLYTDIIKNNNIHLDFNINFHNLIIITFVRNPYSKIISELFFYGLIDSSSTTQDVFITMKNIFLVNNNTFDNHNLPQYMFIIDENNNVNKNLKIIKTETLTDDLKNVGFDDFHFFVNSDNINKDYSKYYNSDSIKLVNEYYEKDFFYFGYEMIKL